MIADLQFHHVGVACRDIDAEATHFATLGYTTEGNAFEDRIQGVRGLFMVGQGPRMELLEPIDDAMRGGSSTNGVLAPWLSSGTKLYHLAYVAPDLRHAIGAMRGRRAKLVVQPVPAVAFDGREIAFVMLPNRLLVELISAR
ncbi:MAG TPA: VOC family protein [Casimicrobiaceae bacterium]|nr:VOC family protein [Casimicrobiaceae bacterium]